MSKNKLYLGIAIGVCGALIGGAIYYVKKKKTSVVYTMDDLNIPQNNVKAEDKSEETTEAVFNSPTDYLKMKPDETKRVNYSKTSNAKQIEDLKKDSVVIKPEEDGPYVISPDEFKCSDNGYSIFVLFAYDDGFITNEDGELINDIELDIIFGNIDPVDHFGEYLDDAVYIRNDFKKAYYEVILKEGNYYNNEQEE